MKLSQEIRQRGWKRDTVAGGIADRVEQLEEQNAALHGEVKATADRVLELAEMVERATEREIRFKAEINRLRAQPEKTIAPASMLKVLSENPIARMTPYQDYVIVGFGGLDPANPRNMSRMFNIPLKPQVIQNRGSGWRATIEIDALDLSGFVFVDDRVYEQIQHALPQ